MSAFVKLLQLKYLFQHPNNRSFICLMKLYKTLKIHKLKHRNKKCVGISKVKYEPNFDIQVMKNKDIFLVFSSSMSQ